jgi:hypothetical protein
MDTNVDKERTRETDQIQPQMNADEDLRNNREWTRI